MWADLETAVNRALLKMLSPWWKAKLSVSGFTDSVQSGRCTVVHDTPRVAELALNAARLRVRQADLVLEADLGLVFKLWQLADMWQFGYLSSLCQGAMKELLTDTDPETLKDFAASALEHSETVPGHVLIPFFLDNPQQRSHGIYLAFDDNTMLRLAELAPIAGFQAQSRAFITRLTQCVSTWGDDDVLRYMQSNPEARSEVLYSQRSLECCMLLFATAPLPFVKQMVRVALHSDWTSKQKQLAMLAIDFSRVTKIDQEYLSAHEAELPNQAYVFQALWHASTRQAACSKVHMTTSAPWAITVDECSYLGDDVQLRAGPVTIILRSRNQAIFYCNTPAYAIRRLEHAQLGRRSSVDVGVKVVQPGKPFHFGQSTSLVVYEAANAAVLSAVQQR